MMTICAEKGFYSTYNCIKANGSEKQANGSEKQHFRI